jgi:hypothetical protein
MQIKQRVDTRGCTVSIVLTSEEITSDYIAAQETTIYTICLETINTRLIGRGRG